MKTVFTDALDRIAQLTGGHVNPDDHRTPAGIRLALALAWNQGTASLSASNHAHTGFEYIRGFLGPQPATIFGTSTTRLDSEVNDASLFAYHQSIHWTIVASDQEAIISNSHWKTRGDWFQLPPIKWSMLDSRMDDMISATPAGVASGELERIATKLRAPDEILTPIDDSLVARLDFWRREALRYVPSTTNPDRDLHTLFAQLFVLRAIEDRNLAPGVDSLSDAIRHGFSADVFRLIFQDARDAIQSQLFSDDPSSRVPPFILEGIIRDLYEPQQLPHGSRRYDFAWIDVDVLGRAYEKYLSSAFSEIDPPPQLRLFEQPVRGVIPRTVQKSGGVYYTPHYLVAALTETAISESFAAARDSEFIPRIADFACGSGSFLVEAFSSLLKRLRKRDPDRDWVRVLVDGRHIVGIDIDPRAVEICRLNLWIRFTGEPNPLPLPSIDNLVVEGDALGDEVWHRIPEVIDVVLGNPPFISTGKPHATTDLQERFTTAQGRFDYASLFIELAIQRVAPCGTLALVVPNRTFRNRDASRVREMLTLNSRVLAVVDFGTSEVFGSTKAYIGCLIAQKDGLECARSTFAANAVLVTDIVTPRYLGADLCAAIQTGSDSHGITSFVVELPPGPRPWVLVSPESRRIRMHLEERGLALGEFAEVFQGIRTGANDVFLLTIESTDGVLAQAVNNLGDAAILEMELLHPAAYGSEIKRYSPPRSTRHILYPYQANAAISEEEFRDSFPNTFLYLSRYRSLLEDRSGVGTNQLQWFELVRKRNFAWLTAGKLLTRDLATKTSFTLDETGSLFLVGGTAVVPPGEEYALSLLGYLNSSVATDYLAQLAPAFRGGFLKLEPQHLNALPIPRFIIDLTDSARRLGELATQAIHAYERGFETVAHDAESEIDEIVLREIRS